MAAAQPLYRREYHGIPAMETVTAKLTPRLTQELDGLIEAGWYANRSEAIRDAVRILLERKRLQRLEAAVREDIAWGSERA